MPLFGGSTAVASLLGGAAAVVAAFGGDVQVWPGASTEPQTVQLLPVADTSLFASQPTTSFGTNTQIFVDDDEPRQGLIRFDLSAIPAGATIQSAVLELRTNNAGSPTNAHMMLVPWTETSTWSSLSAGVQADGVEAKATPEFNTGQVPIGTQQFTMTATVQAWVDGQPNHGLVFIQPPPTNRWIWNSREGNPPPRLEVVYSGAGQPPPPPPPPPTGTAFHVAPTGNDGNPGTEAQPWRTIQKAADTLNAGETVYVKAGTYAPFSLTRSGSAAAGPIIFSAYPGHERQAVVDGTGFTSDCINSVGRSFIQIRGFFAQNCGRAGIWIEGNTAASPATDIVVAGNRIHNTRSMGIALYGEPGSNMLPELEVRLKNVIAELNEISLTNEPTGSNEGISAGNGLQFAEIRFNYLHDSQQYGIDCKIGCYDVDIHGNEVHDFEKHGIYLDSRNRRVRIFNNLLHHNRDGIFLAREEVGAMQDIQIFNNVVYDNERWCFIINQHADDTGDPFGVFDDVRFVNNTCYSNDETGTGDPEILIEDFDGNTLTNIFLRNNVVFGGSGGIVNQHGSAVTMSNNLTANPLFVDAPARNLRLQAGSPAINAGTSTDAPAADYDGVARPQGAGVDIGAFERVP